MIDFVKLRDNKFDVAVTWPLPRDGSLAYMCAKDVHIYYDKATVIDLFMQKLCTNKSVIVIGDYWNKQELDKLRSVAKSIVVHTHNEDICNLDKIRQTHPTTYHIWNRLYDSNSEFYYRGFIYHSRTNGVDNIYEYMHFYMDKLPSEKELIDIGKVIDYTHNQDAKSIVEASSIRMKCNGLDCCIVYGATQPVMPLASAAAHDADVGIVVRLFPNKGFSRLTFHTLYGADLSFVHGGSAHFPGGGGKTTRGCCVDGLVVLDPQLSSLEECLDAMSMS